jgi:hypothetical protein
MAARQVGSLAGGGAGGGGGALAPPVMHCFNFLADVAPHHPGSVVVKPGPPCTQ